MLFRIQKVGKAYDGEYEFDDDRVINQLEWRWIVRFSGYYPLTLREGFQRMDPDLILVLAVIAMYRAGKFDRGDVQDVIDEFDEAPFGEAITVVATDEPEENPAPLAIAHGG